MSLMTRAIAACALLSLAAIPVAALTVHNTSSNEVSIGVDTGTEEAVYKIPAGGSVEVAQDCAADCAVTGPWGYSRLVAQNATIETDGSSLVTAGLPAPAQAAKTQGLVPQNPAGETADAAEPVKPAAAPAARPERAKRTSRPRRPAQRQAKKTPSAGSFQLLFEGPGK